MHVTPARAARLYGLVGRLKAGGRPRDVLLVELGIGLRTFYRELELLRRCGIKVRLRDRRYVLQSTAEEAEGRLPFPDPQLSFAEMAELIRGEGPAARRLAAMYQGVVQKAEAGAPRKTRRRKS